MAKLTLVDIAAGYALIATINSNNALVEAALEKTLSRDGTTPNTMSADFDMNSQKITNLLDGTNNQDVVTLAQLNAAKVVASTIAGTGVTIADAGAFFAGSTAESIFAELGATTGAAVIGLLDSGGNYTATDIEAALAELASVATGEGASIIGVKDSAGNFTGTDVEAVLAEIFALGLSVRKLKTADEAVTSSAAVQDDNHLTGISLAADTRYAFKGVFSLDAGAGGFRFTPNFSQVVQEIRSSMFFVDTLSNVIGDSNTIGTGYNFISAGNGTGILTWEGIVHTHASLTSTLKLRWAQDTSNGAATTLEAGSYIEVTKLS